MATAENLKLIPSPKDTMVVAREDGRLYVVDFSYNPELDDPNAVDWALSVSKILIGKLQQNRSRLLTLEEIEFENVITTNQAPALGEEDKAVTVYGSLDGKNISSTITPHLAEDLGEFLRYTTRLTATNFSIQLRGTYALNTITCVYHSNGRR